MYPIIITAPHACSTIDDPSLRKRIALTDYEIFKCSDPFTNELKEFECASYKHIAKTHRLVCDFNRAPNVKDAFHTVDFFGRSVFKKGMGFTKEEKLTHLREWWWPFHQRVLDSIYKLDDEAHEVILLVDYHNTAGDHPLNQKNEYMPSVVISNLGKGVCSEKAEMDSNLASIPMKYLRFLQSDLKSKLELGVEMNTIYKGGYNIIWFKQLRETLDINAKIYAVQIEYNVDYVFNPISKRIDRIALSKMQKAINEALMNLYDQLWADEVGLKFATVSTEKPSIIRVK